MKKLILAMTMTLLWITAVPLALEAGQIQHVWIYLTPETDGKTAVSTFKPWDIIFTRLQFCPEQGGNLVFRWINPVGNEEKVVSREVTFYAKSEGCVPKEEYIEYIQFFPDTKGVYDPKLFGTWKLGIFLDGEELATIEFVIREVAK
jgi:hypothetical protein